MRLLWWRTANKRATDMDEKSDDTERRLADSSRAVEQSRRALDQVAAKVPRVQAHANSLRRVAEDNGLAGIILYGFRKGI